MGTPETGTIRTQPNAPADSPTSAAGDTIAALRGLAVALAGGAASAEALRQALAAAAHLTDSSHATILLLDERGERICYRVTLNSKNIAPLELVAGPMMSRGLAGWVARERCAALVHDTEREPRWLPGPGLGDLRSAIVAPLFCADRTLGLLTLGHELPDHYADVHLRVAELIAAQLALALAPRRAAGWPDADESDATASCADQPRVHDLVALSAELHGLNHAADRLPPDVFFEILRAFFGTMTLAVERHHGAVDHLGGDGLLATFGGAEAARAAVAAGLEMQAAARALSERWRARLEIATGTLDIGIARGRAIVGRIHKEQPAARGTGAVVDQAIRLRRLARGGEILVSAGVAVALPRGVSFAVMALPPLRLGAEQLQQIFSVGAPGHGRPAASMGAKPSER